MAGLRYTPAMALDLTLHTGGDASPVEDFITFFFKIEPGIANTGLQLFFFDSGTSGWANFYMPIENRQPSTSVQGLGSILEVRDQEGDIINRDRLTDQTAGDAMDLQIAEKTWVIPNTEWQYASIPKRAFTVNNGFRWSNVTSLDFRIDFQTAFYISDLLLVGGGNDNSGGGGDAQGTSDPASNGGLQGTYRYKLTYFNEDTGNRSNPCSATAIAKNVNRGAIQLTNLPESSDAQVTHLEIWRTVGDGTEFFFAARVENGTTEFLDEVADHDHIDSTANVAVLQATPEYRTDNAVPDSDHDQHIIDKLTAFWIKNTSGEQGKVFYSPIGRPESQKGFIDVTRAGDPLHRLVVYNGQRYVFSESKVYRIDGDDPYVATEMGGIPGVAFAQRRTVVATPFGIVYQAADGIRAFNGYKSELVNIEPVQRIFRGETQEGIGAFEGTVACFARGEYIISNGSATLAVDLTHLSWREVGFDDITALMYEWDTDTIVGGRASNTQELENEGVFTDAASAIPYEWETPAMDGPNDQVVIVEDVFIDMNPGNTTVTSQLMDRFGVAVTLTSPTGNSRTTTETQLDILALKPSVRFSGNATAQVTLYDVELEVRNLQMGINVLDAGREAIDGRYREDLTANGSIIFEIPPELKEFDQTDRLYVIDRLTVEADTGEANVTPIITLSNTAVTLTNINTDSRQIVSYDINRIGPVNQVRFDGQFFNTGGTRPQIYRVELHVRPLALGLNITTTGQRGQTQGHLTATASEIEWEVQPALQDFNQLDGLFWIDRLVFEIDTDSNNFTPVITTPAGAITLSTINTASRKYVELSVQRPGPVYKVELQGTWTNDVQFFGAELFMRPVNLGIVYRDGRRLSYDGQLVDPATSVKFVVDPDRHEVDGQYTAPLIERIYFDANTNDNDLTFRVVTEVGTFFFEEVSSSSRETIVLEAFSLGNLLYIELVGDFTAEIAIYGLELSMRNLDMNINLLTGE